jgi:hypothetical protein
MSPARASRIKLIRTRVAAAAVAVFIAVWGVIGVRLASGDDPALTQSATTGVTTADQPSQAVSPVTTSQS